MPPAHKCLSRNTFLLDELSYQDVLPQLTLLTVAYARGLQYWVEKLKLPKSLDLCPLAGSVAELRETMREHFTFNHWDVVQGLGAIHLGSTSQWPQITLFSCILSLPVEGQDFTETTTHTTSSAAEEDMTRCATPQSETEKENQYLLVIIASVGQLNLGPGGDGPKRSRADIHDENTFQNVQMAAAFPGPTRAIGYGGATVKELDE